MFCEFTCCADVQLAAELTNSGSLAAELTNCTWADKCSWAHKLQLYWADILQLSWRVAAEMTSWRGDDRLHLSCSQLSWQSSWQVGLTQQVNKWQLSWQIAPKLTYHSQADTLQPNTWIAVKLIKHSGADKVQPGRSSETKEKADSSSNMLSWYDKLVWTNRVQLSWQFAAELTMCSWADKLHVSQLIAAELTNCSWAELTYSSWGDISRVLEWLVDNWSMSFVVPHVAFLVMWGVACLLPCYPSAAVNNQPSCVSCQVITKTSWEYVLRSSLTIWASGALPTSELTAYCRWADTLQGLETIFYSDHKHVVIVSTFRYKPCSLDLGADPSRRSHHVIFHVKVWKF